MNKTTIKQQAPKEFLAVLPADMTITKNGIEPFLWPINHKELLKFGQTLEHALSAYYRQHPNQEQITPYKIAAKNYVTTVCACFQGEFLADRLAQKNLELKLPPNWTIWASLISGKAPPKPPYIDALKLQKPPKQSLFYKLLDIKRVIKFLKKSGISKQGQIKVDNLILNKYPTNKLSSAVIATQRLPLVSQHAKSIKNKQDVYLSSALNWFASINAQDLKAQQDSSQDELIENTIMEIINNGYKDFNVSPHPEVKTYLLNTLQDFINLIKVHMQQLRQRDDIPSTLWTGSGGHIWDAMLRCEVLRRGGHVCAHDHGGGVPHLDHPEKGWIEMWSCDEFITYSPQQADTFKRYMKSWPNLDENLPIVRAIDESHTAPTIKAIEKYTRPDTPIKKIRIFSTIYSSEEGRGLPIYPHMAYIDWQARLIAHFKEWGYEVSFKPHPDSRLGAPDQYSSVLDTEIILDPLDSMDESFDLYVFDLSNTSVLQTALLTNKPVVVIDFSVMEWREDAFDLFVKRCGYAKGHYNNNRMEVDWRILKEQVETAAKKSNNSEFAKTFY